MRSQAELPQPPASEGTKERWQMAAVHVGILCCLYPHGLGAACWRTMGPSHSAHCSQPQKSCGLRSCHDKDKPAALDLIGKRHHEDLPPSLLPSMSPFLPSSSFVECLPLCQALCLVLEHAGSKTDMVLSSRNLQSSERDTF